MSGDGVMVNVTGYLNCTIRVKTENNSGVHETDPSQMVGHAQEPVQWSFEELKDYGDILHQRHSRIHKSDVLFASRRKRLSIRIVTE